jgi:positive regulator of sigma E activity
MAAHERVTVTAENLVGAKPGDKVVIEAASRSVFSAVALVYVLPVVLFFGGYFAGEVWNAGTLFGAVGFFLGLAVAVLVSRHQTRTGREIQFRIVAYSE